MRKLYGPEIIYRYPNYVTHRRKFDPIKISLFFGGVFSSIMLFQFIKKFRK